MKWAESARLPRKIRETKESFEKCIRGCEVTSSKREDLLLDVLPCMSVVGQTDPKMKKDLHKLCRFPLRGRVIEMEDEMQVEIPTKQQTSWLEDDDIED